jgi:hypothetical protein
MADQQDRLRDAFAQLLALGQDKAAPIEAVWAEQGRNQLPGPPPNPNVERPQIYNDPTVGTPIQQAPVPPSLDFPTATPKGDPTPPFPGAKSVDVKPFGLPKKSTKKGKG